MLATERFGWGVLAATMIGAPLVAAQDLERRKTERAEASLRQEGEAVVALADAAVDGQPVPSDFSLDWHNDFLKAQPGTFIPFIVRIEAPQLKTRAALLYVRAARRIERGREGQLAPRRRAEGPEVLFHPFEEIYSIELVTEKGHAVRIARGFSLQPGDYDLTVVVREREGAAAGRRPLAAILRQPLSVPDFAGPDLATSTVILADGLTVLPETPHAGRLRERPYVVGNREIHPAMDAEFARTEELIVIFLVYNPAVREDKHFDLEVEYHFFQIAGDRETYFNRTETQRFGRDLLGPNVDPSTGHPVMAGQGVPLAGFPDGEYRLSIRVKDLVSGQSLERRVPFAVRS